MRKSTLVLVVAVVGGALWINKIVGDQSRCMAAVRENPPPVGMHAVDLRRGCLGRPGEVLALYK